MSSGPLLYPEQLALLHDPGPGASELVDLQSQRVFALDGALANSLHSALAGAELDPLLEALGESHPLRSRIDALRDQPATPLTAARALRLDGFDTLFVELTGSCQLRCVHCYAQASASEQATLPRQHALEILADADALGFRRVQWTGGDPLLHPDLVELVAATAEHGIPVCEIFTSGQDLHSELLAQLAPHRPRLAFSVYSSRAEVHDRITTVTGSHARTLEAIRTCLAKGLQLRVAVVAMAENGDHLEETLASLRSLGVEEIGVSRQCGVGRGEPYRGALPAIPLRPGTTTADRPAPSPRHGQGKLCVAADGAVYPCIFNRVDLLGRIPARSLREIATAPQLAGTGEPARAEELLPGLRQRLQCAPCRLTALALQIARS